MNKEEKKSRLRQLEKQRLDILPKYKHVMREFRTLDTLVGEITQEILSLQRELNGNIIVVTNDRGFGEKKVSAKREKKGLKKSLKGKIESSKLSNEDKEWLKKQLMEG